MVRVHTLEIAPPLLNASCAWASDFAQLAALYASPHTGAVTTRTATLHGFSEDERNTFVLTAPAPLASLNSYGYSPHPLASYLVWVPALLALPHPPKPIILSLTASTAPELTTMLAAVQSARAALPAPTALALELNTSCPNIRSTPAPPPAYDPARLRPLLDALAAAVAADPTLAVGLKLPPYLYDARFAQLVALLHTYSRNGSSPFAFLTCTNTLGNCLLFADQTAGYAGEAVPAADTVNTPDAALALPTAYGGLGGEPLHALALGNVHAFARLLAAHPDPAMRRIAVFGVGGVTTPAAVARMHRAGATVVECATLLGREGVRAFEILAGTS